MGITIRDVAKACGVSTYTVSSVLNGKGRVGIDTRARVLKTINELGYDPARNAPLSVRRINLRHVACVFPFEDPMNSGFFYRAKQEVERAATELGIQSSFSWEGEVQDWINSGFSEDHNLSQCDHFIYFAPKYNWQPACKSLIAQKIPTAVIRRGSRIKGLLSVTDDDAEGMRQVLEHLISLGHKNIALFGQFTLGGSANKRIMAFKSVLEEHGLVNDDRLMMRMGPQGNERNAPDFKAHLVPRLQKLRDGGLPITAMVCLADLILPRVVSCLQDGGYRVPDDIAIAGYCDEVLAEQCTPTITTLRLPLEEMVGFTIKQLQAHNVALREALFDNRLVIRQSCGAQITK